MDTLHDINIHLENKKESRHFFLFIAAMYTFVYITKNCFSSSMASIVAEGVFTKSQVGLISALFYLVYAPLQVLGGIAADKYSPESLIKIGLIGSGIANLVIFLNQSYYVILVSWIANAVVQFALWPATFKIVASQLVRSDKSNNVFLISLSSSIGLMLAFFISAIIPKWQYTFAFSAFGLFAFAIALQLYSKHLDPYMKKDYDIPQPQTKDSTKKKASNMKIYLSSGLFFILAGCFVNEIANYGIKTLTPTMLMETYTDISDSIGNFLNVFIIASGILGTLLVKFVLCDKVIKNEAWGMTLITLAAIPFAAIRMFVGKLPVWTVVICSCLVAVSTTGVLLFQKYYNLSFSKYGINGTVAGILNAVLSLGIVVQSFALPAIAQYFDWRTVTVIITLMLALSAVFMLIAVVPYKKFKNK